MAPSHSQQPKYVSAQHMCPRLPLSCSRSSAVQSLDSGPFALFLPTWRYSEKNSLGYFHQELGGGELLLYSSGRMIFCCSFENFTGWNYVTACPQILPPCTDFSFLFHPVLCCPIPLTNQLRVQLLRALDWEELLIRWKSPVPGLRLCSWCLGSLNPF